MPELFAGGDYLPLTATGACANHVFAFARQRDGRAAITIVPRLVIPLVRGERRQATGEAWGDTRIELPADLAGRVWRSALTGREVRADAAGEGGALGVAGLFAELPLDLLVSAEPR
jgi:(1->4)-alpha-D-glucan 1-alpha-D-glucosylmutase